MADEKVPTLAEIEQQIKALELEDMQLRLEETKDRVQALKATKAVKSLQNSQRQGQLRADLLDRKQVISDCTHRQGGSPGKERKGKGPSALRRVILPDDRGLVMCANCGLRVFSPLPSLGYQQPFKGESKAASKKRIEKFELDKAEFNRLVELAEDQLTPEAAQPMHCGTQFAFQNSMGNNVSMPAPCDTYAQGTDNRNVA
jgi:hypothetical protein